MLLKELMYRKLLADAIIQLLCVKMGKFILSEEEITVN